MSTRERPGRIPSAPSGLEVPPAGNVDVTRVRAYMKDGRLQAFVQGELGDGCTRLERITQSRAGNSIDITVTSKREGEVCTMILSSGSTRAAHYSRRTSPRRVATLIASVRLVTPSFSKR
jgi:hypothetical protein